MPEFAELPDVTFKFGDQIMLDKDALVALVRLTEDQVYKSLDADVDAVVRRNLPKQQAAEEIADLLDFQIDEICMEVFN